MLVPVAPRSMQLTCPGATLAKMVASELQMTWNRLTTEHARPRLPFSSDHRVLLYSALRRRITRLCIQYEVINCLWRSLSPLKSQGLANSPPSSWPVTSQPCRLKQTNTFVKCCNRLKRHPRYPYATSIPRRSLSTTHSLHSHRRQRAHRLGNDCHRGHFPSTTMMRLTTHG